MRLSYSGLSAAMAMCGALAMSAAAQERVVDADAATRPAADEAGYYKASDLIGMEVRGTDNVELGEVQDLFIDRQTNEIEYLILDTGVFADLDGRQPVIPWTIVQRNPGTVADTYYLSVPLTQERVKGAPTIMLSEVALTGTPEGRTKVTEFYGAEIRERRVSRPDLERNRDEAGTPGIRRDQSEGAAPSKPQSGNRPRTGSESTPKPDSQSNAGKTPRSPATPGKPVNP